MIEAKRSPSLEAWLAEGRERALAGDESVRDERVAYGDVSSYGTAPGEEWTGREAVLSLTLAQQAELNDQAGIENAPDPDLRVEAYEAGDTGWAVAHGSFHFEDGRSVPIRSIGVFVRDDDSWVVVCSGVHALVPNERLPELAA